VSEAFDVAVVGGDLAAGTVAVALARAHCRVLCVDSSSQALGPGGLLWPAEFAALRPDLAEGLPGGARLAEHRWQMLTDAGALSVEYREGGGEATATGPRLILDREAGRWLLGRAEQAGARVVHGPSTRLEEKGSVRGVRAGNEEFATRVTVVSEEGDIPTGGSLTPDGLSGTFRLDPATLRNRLGVRPGSGVSVEAILAFLEPSIRGVGFLQGYDQSVTVGVFAHSARGPAPRDVVSSTFDRFVAHPSIARLIAGGSREAGGTLRYLPTRPDPGSSPSGLLRVGRAGGFDLAAGPLSTGPGYSIRTALIAAEAVQEVLRSDSPTGPAASTRFGRRLRSSGIPRRLASQRERSRRIVFRPRLHAGYPGALHGLMHRIMTESGGRKEPVVGAARATRREAGVGWGELAFDLLETGGAL
jgi:flavin-dependent dehydrogenase